MTRRNRLLASEGVVLYSAINTGVAAFGKSGKKAHKGFHEMISKLSDS